ncbi:MULTISPECIES: ATP-grasp fold amidoligase family protein [unclassified Rhizobium]|uniref:ATP-grasp fold amidoligase family protein n=1 Tax=unclassified Rhizobium TaxID=2613769 RepID=UPI0006462D24|nr:MULTISPECIES: ATP-grasp fold amidoligase family protein [unclassified Rhizobium]MBN8952175.1 polysaccharide biosynthesis protein [Rhizobium tropici]OJY75493.1 MAG: polysaccharide biosynthesis protein [Rhizobium sp. 60-20]RKD66777.1 teichuronopeptide biosynthesis TupA-like protein [Rhizobium sp. WW_1]
MIDRAADRDGFLIPGYLQKGLRERMHNLLWRLMSPLPDKPYCALKYRTIRGNFPNLSSPQTFTEKIQARKLYDRNPLFPRFVDKADAKVLIAERVGDQYVIPTLWVGKDLVSVDWSGISLPAVVKPTHASGVGRFLYGEADVERLLKSNPSGEWLAIDHASYNREWAYSQLEPRILVESMLLVDGRVPWDYRLFTFDGKVSHIEIDIRENGRGYSCNYTPDWQKLPFYDRDYLGLYPGDVARPSRLDEMIHVAETVARDIDFVRVDLYASAEWVRVGELTFYPGGGFEAFEPDEYDLSIGRKWKLGFEIPKR